MCTSRSMWWKAAALTLPVAASAFAADQSADMVFNTGAIAGEESASSQGVRGNSASAWWSNGEADGRFGLRSQSLGSSNYRVADDYILESGHWHLINSIDVCMAISTNVVNPVVALEIYSDCNGKPGDLLTTISDPESITITPLTGPTYPNTATYKISFRLNSFDFGALDGCSRVFISPYGVGAGNYFWISANDGKIQGVQGQAKASAGSTPRSWTDVDDLCCGAPCTDFCFEVVGKVCYAVKEQGDYVADGLDSIKFPQFSADDARAADNFQISSAQVSVGLCRVEVFIATNCEPEKVFCEIYANDCDEPSSLLYTLTDPVFVDLDETIAQPGGVDLTVYKFTFDCPPGVILNGGENYWLAAGAEDTGSIFSRALFLFKDTSSTCKDIHITEAVYKNPFAGINEFEDVSEIDGSSGAAELAFNIYATPIPCITTGEVSTPLAGDANSDGVVNFLDIVEVLRSFGSSSAN